MLVDLLAVLQGSILFQAALVYFAAYPIVTSIMWVTTSLLFRLRWEPKDQRTPSATAPLPSVSVRTAGEEAPLLRSPVTITGIPAPAARSRIQAADRTLDRRDSGSKCVLSAVKECAVV